MNLMARNEIIIDAEGSVLGRMASTVAKRLLTRERIIIVNAEKAVISGKRKSIINEAKRFLQVGHPKKGPYHPRRPDEIVKRTIRGMLPRRKPKGQQAYKRLRVYIGVPDELREREFVRLFEADAGKLKCPYIKVSELSEAIGWKTVGE